VAGSTVTATPAVTVLRRLEQLGARQRRQLAHRIQAGIEIEVEMEVDIEVEASGDACRRRIRSKVTTEPPCTPRLTGRARSNQAITIPALSHQFSWWFAHAYISHRHPLVGSSRKSI
jgi:predicted metalloprotease